MFIWLRVGWQGHGSRAGARNGSWSRRWILATMGVGNRHDDRIATESAGTTQTDEPTDWRPDVSRALSRLPARAPRPGEIVAAIGAFESRGNMLRTG